MKITYEDTKMLETTKGGFKSSTLALVGVPWPTKKGWRSRLIDREIPDELFIEAVQDAEMPPLPNAARRERLRHCKSRYRNLSNPKKVLDATKTLGMIEIMEKPTDTANTETAQALTTPFGSTFHFWGDEYEKIADLGDGYALIAHPNGPAICDGKRLSTIDPYQDPDGDEWLDLKHKAIRAYREWSWPQLKERLTFPAFDRASKKD